MSRSDTPLPLQWPHFVIDRVGDVTRVHMHTATLTAAAAERAAADLRIVATKLTAKTKLLIDARKVQQMGSRVIAAFVEIDSQLRTTSGEMRLVIRAEAVREVFTVTRLDEHLHLHTSADSASDAFQRSTAAAFDPVSSIPESDHTD